MSGKTKGILMLAGMVAALFLGMGLIAGWEIAASLTGGIGLMVGAAWWFARAIVFIIEEE